MGTERTYSEEEMIDIFLAGYRVGDNSASFVRLAGEPFPLGVSDETLRRTRAAGLALIKDITLKYISDSVPERIRNNSRFQGEVRELEKSFQDKITEILSPQA